jgi:hypothetical protein
VGTGAQLCELLAGTLRAYRIQLVGVTSAPIRAPFLKTPFGKQKPALRNASMPVFVVMQALHMLIIEAMIGN